MGHNLYDIADIPVFPYVPGTWVWGTLLICALLAGLAWPAVQRLHKWRQQHRPPLEVAERQVSELCSSSSPETLSRLSLILRRLLSSYTRCDFSGLSADELRNLAARLKLPALRPVIEKLQNIERLRFGPAHGIQIEPLVKDVRVELIALRGKEELIRAELLRLEEEQFESKA